LKINDVGRIGMTNPYHKQSEQREARTERKKQTDNIQISKEAQDMHSIENQSQQERVNQIANLKEQVQTGTYFVDAGKLAEKLLPFLK
jgi:negative regulator of flagellin synthesis FlgM